jgi:hypothetical protein
MTRKVRLIREHPHHEFILPALSPQCGCPSVYGRAGTDPDRIRPSRWPPLRRSLPSCRLPWPLPIECSLPLRFRLRSLWEDPSWFGIYRRTSFLWRTSILRTPQSLRLRSHAVSLLHKDSGRLPLRRLHGRSSPNGPSSARLLSGADRWNHWQRFTTCDSQLPNRKSHPGHRSNRPQHSLRAPPALTEDCGCAPWGPEAFRPGCGCSQIMRKGFRGICGTPQRIREVFPTDSGRSQVGRGCSADGCGRMDLSRQASGGSVHQLCARDNPSIRS